MARPRRKKKKSESDSTVVDAELLPAFNPLDEQRTPEEIRADEEEFQLRLRARWDTIQKMGPDERYDALTALMDMGLLRFAERINERDVWLDHPDPAVRGEALEFIDKIQNRINQTVAVRVQLYNALGLGEKPGALPGGKEVPRVLIPSRTQEEFEKEYSATLQQFGPPKGVA